MPLPKNPIILLSFINTKLRDEYSSLEKLCESLDINIQDLCEKLQNTGYTYDECLNQFV